MKVKVSVGKIVECEVDDKFKILDLPGDADFSGIPDEMWNELFDAVAETTGFVSGLREDYWEALEKGATIIDAIESAETGNVLGEA